MEVIILKIGICVIIGICVGIIIFSIWQLITGQKSGPGAEDH